MSKKRKKLLLYRLFYLSVPLFILHSVEEFITLYFVPNHFAHEIPIQTFISIEIITWVVLSSFAWLLSRRILSVPILVLPGILYLYQIEHIYHSIEIGGYYPGTITGVALFVLGLFLWKELLSRLKS